MRRNTGRSKGARRQRRSELDPADCSTTRLSITLDPDVVSVARRFAELTGFRHSFSAYLNDVLQRDNEQRRKVFQTVLRRDNQQLDRLSNEPLLPFLTT